MVIKINDRLTGGSAAPRSLRGCPSFCVCPLCPIRWGLRRRALFYLCCVWSAPLGWNTTGIFSYLSPASCRIDCTPWAADCRCQRVAVSPCPLLVLCLFMASISQNAGPYFRGKSCTRPLPDTPASIAWSCPDNLRSLPGLCCFLIWRGQSTLTPSRRCPLLENWPFWWLATSRRKWFAVWRAERLPLFWTWGPLLWGRSCRVLAAWPTSFALNRWSRFFWTKWRVFLTGCDLWRSPALAALSFWRDRSICCRRGSPRLRGRRGGSPLCISREWNCSSMLLI